MAIESTVFFTFGFHTQDTLPTHSARDFDATWHNVLNLMGYIPVFSFVPCVARLINPLCDRLAPVHQAPTSVKIAVYMRGFFEGLGLGALYLIPDLIATAYRFAPCTYSDRDQNGQHSGSDEGY